MFLEDYTTVVETVYHQKYINTNPLIPNLCMLIVMITLSIIYYSLRAHAKTKKLKPYDLLLLSILFALIGTAVPTKVTHRSSVLSHNYEYTINTEKHDAIDDYGVNHQNLDNVILSFKDDELLPEELKTYDQAPFSSYYLGNHDWIVGTVGKKGITLVEKEEPTYDEVELDEVREKYDYNGYVIITKEQLGDDYDVIVEKMKNVHGENYQNPYQVKYPNTEE